MSLSDGDLLGDQIKPGDRFRHRVLDLTS
jgi:hypothetical protein